MDGDAHPFFIEISVSHFSIAIHKPCLPKYDYLIVFKPAWSSENYTYILHTLPSAKSTCTTFTIWSLNGRFCMSILTVHTIFARILNLSNFAQPPVFVCF